MVQRGGDADKDGSEKVDVAGYIADMLSALQPMAEQASHHFLAYLIRLAREQAEAERQDPRRRRRAPRPNRAGGQ